ncbi:MAG TPA: biotin--[acetyl-CoA-carboxylase] ligase [Stellaceae bacterium]|jgi:BirA family biotin operon repressor/biotin-[acetyl-CoA-carboxylase] ligase|nr:biotin--[acetyl-CoA-carboxylase] ligase [Stellaceae bacterium]
MTGQSGLSPFFRLVRFGEIDSTNEEAKRRAASGAPEGTLVTAAAQSAGRGRRGRSWVSVPGNLYMSLLLRPERSAGAAAQLGFAAALALGEAVSPLLPPGRELGYKWPNDVLVGGRKISGILLESQASAEGELDWLVVGIGVNIASHPAASDYPATSLAAEGAATVTPATLLEGVAGRLLFWYELWLAEGFAPLRRAWLAHAIGLEQPIRVRLADGESTGRFAGLDEEGALLLENGATLRRIAAGDVFPAAG